MCIGATAAQLTELERPVKVNLFRQLGTGSPDPRGWLGLRLERIGPFATLESKRRHNLLFRILGVGNSSYALTQTLNMTRQPAHGRRY